MVADRKYAWEKGLCHLLFEVGAEKEREGTKRANQALRAV